MSGMMDAWVIEGFGGPDAFQRACVPVPEPGPREVLIDVRASSVNPVDYKVRDGRIPFLAPDMPAILHPNCAGVIKATGRDVTGFAVGDEVFSFASGIGGKAGALADAMAADAAMVAKKPTTCSFEEAAALPLVAVTAWLSLIDQAAIGAADHVMVQGGTGGVGHIAVQLARWRGAKVFATCGDKRKCSIAEELGARKAFDYMTTDPETIVQQATADRGFDVVYNIPGTPSVDHAVAVAAFCGTILDILGEFPVKPGFQLKWLTFRSLFAGRAILTGEGKERVGEILTEVASLVDGGHVKPLIDQSRFCFEDVGKAHSHAEHGRPTGKVVLHHPAHAP
ncbi:MAG: zinc-binding dehydrogenase [Pseudomonadota bacterium]